jgi:septal ring factor EnvC (AmiA/AmiB activator)
VTAGEPIALVGNSGGQSTIGVYFEIRRDGKPIDPGAWLAPS